MNVIILAASEADVTRWHDAHPDVTIAAEASPTIRKGWDKLLFGARIVRLDSWQHDQQVVDALKVAQNRYGLVDPTGLLGGSQYGAERNSTGSVPVPFGQGKAGATVRAAKRATKPFVTKLMRDRDLDNA